MAFCWKHSTYIAECYGRSIANNCAVTIRPLARVPRPLATLVQPIVDTSSGTPRLFAVECLTRGPRGSRLEEALPLFDYIRRRGLESEMDRLCIAQALRCAGTCECRITVNVHPASLTATFAPFLIEQCRRAAIDPSRVIVEVGEQSPSADPLTFRRTLDALRAGGVAIAVDDVGYGHSNLRAILECRPEYLKVDRYFVGGVDSDRARVAAIESIQQLAGFFGSRVIAEGVERMEEWQALRLLGIDLYQGFLFSRPAAISGDGTQHPVVDWILQSDETAEKAFVEARIDVAAERQQTIDGPHRLKQGAIQRLRLRALEGLKGKAATDQISVE